MPALLTIHDIAALLRIHRTAAYARTRDPDFPDPLVISGSCYRWYADEVAAYVASRRAPKKEHQRRAVPLDPSAASGAGPASAPPRPRARRRRSPGAAAAAESTPR
ncbi:hypothetical protein ASD84_16045 [Nocardioides sp. Root682]|nr:hypothetical protein ASD84_16045 [Nocardioides sp. Root682]